MLNDFDDYLDPTRFHLVTPRCKKSNKRCERIKVMKDTIEYQRVQDIHENPKLSPVDLQRIEAFITETKALTGNTNNFDYDRFHELKEQYEKNDGDSEIQKVILRAIFKLLESFHREFKDSNEFINLWKKICIILGESYPKLTWDEEKYKRIKAQIDRKDKSG